MRGNNNPLAIPILLILSLMPNSDQRLGQLASFIEATQNTVQMLRSGLDNFYSALVQAIPAQHTNPSSLDFSAQEDKKNDAIDTGEKY